MREIDARTKEKEREREKKPKEDKVAKIERNKTDRENICPIGFHIFNEP